MPSMDLYGAANRAPDPDALEFIRFCYRRRRVGWPELYDEMCAVASRGLFRGYSADDLAERGIGFGLFEMPSLAAVCRTVVAQEQALRRATAPLAVVREAAPGLTAGEDGHSMRPECPVQVASLDETAPAVATREPETVVSREPVGVAGADRWTTSASQRLEGSVRFAVVPSGA